MNDKTRPWFVLWFALCAVSGLAVLAILARPVVALIAYLAA